MSELSGSLVDFSLSAVIRLLADGSKTGILVIQGSRLDGSIFFDDGGLTYATTRKSPDASDDHPNDRREDSGSQTDELIAEVATRLTRQGDGKFIFQADVHPVHPVEGSFPAEQVIELLEFRIALWDEIDTSLGSSDEPFMMTRSIPKEEKISLTGEDWNVLAALGSGLSVTALADVLTMPELSIAETVVRLKSDGLVAVAEVAADSPTAPSHGGRLIEQIPQQWWSA